MASYGGCSISYTRTQCDNTGSGRNEDAGMAWSDPLRTSAQGIPCPTNFLALSLALTLPHSHAAFPSSYSSRLLLLSSLHPPSILLPPPPPPPPFRISSTSLSLLLLLLIEGSEDPLRDYLLTRAWGNRGKVMLLELVLPCPCLRR
jgi:hypothetical protein